MKKRAGFPVFMSYWFGGFVVATVFVLLAAWVIPRYAFQNPAYPLYLEAQRNYAEWHKVQANWQGYHDRQYDRNVFESVLAGRRPLNDIRNSSVRRIASHIQAINPRSSVATRDRVRALYGMIQPGIGETVWSHHMNCAVSTATDALCTYTTPLELLNEPARFEAVLSGDVNQITQVPVIPQEYMATLPTLEEVSPTLPWPHAFWGALAIFAWIGFALGFFITGAFLVEGPSPFEIEPNFILGWVLLVPVLPSKLLLWFVRLLVVDRSQLEIKSEYDKTKQTLEDLKERAQRLGDQKLVESIDKLLARVQSNRTGEELLRIRVAVTELEVTLRSNEEADQVLPRS